MAKKAGARAIAGKDEHRHDPEAPLICFLMGGEAPPIEYCSFIPYFRFILYGMYRNNWSGSGRNLGEKFIASCSCTVESLDSVSGALPSWPFVMEEMQSETVAF